MKRRIRALAAGVVVAALTTTVSPTTRAVGTLDQEQPQADRTFQFGGTFHVYQFVVAGQTGLMDRVEFVLSRHASCSSDLVVEARGFLQGVGSPTSQLFAREVVSAESVGTTPAWLGIDLRPRAPVTANDGFTIVLSAPVRAHTTCYAAEGAIWNPYTNGHYGDSVDGGENWTAGGGGLDLAFKTYVAPFPPTHVLSVTPEGSGSGTVSSHPQGIECGASCSAAFYEGDDVTLTATPAAGSVFDDWSGCDSVDANVCSVSSISAARGVTATFLATHQVTVSKTGVGSIVSSPEGIDCGSVCAASFTDETNVTLVATPGEGHTFAGWSGHCEGNGSCEFDPLSEPRAATAMFVRKSYDVTVTKVGSGRVTNGGAPVIDCGPTCVGAFEHGSIVELAATPDTGWTFSGWSGDCGATTASSGFTGTLRASRTSSMAPPPPPSGGCRFDPFTEAKSVTATFVRKTYAITVSRDGTGTGRITTSPVGIDCGTTCAHPFEHGTSVGLLATPDEGSAFVGWAGDCTGSGACGFADLGGPKTVTAIFADAIAPTVTFDQTPPTKTVKRSASFAFHASEIDVTYECSLDGADFVPCDPQLGYTGLARGQHTLLVRATDDAGNRGESAAYTWKVTNKRRR